jgi:predicted CoA-binding protein
MKKSLKTLVLGASTNPERYSYKAIKMLREHNHPVVAIGVKAGSIDDVDIDLKGETPKDIDTVTLYLSPKNQVEYYDYILQSKPRRVIFNPGTENPEFEALLVANDIISEEACTLVLLSIGQY